MPSILATERGLVSARLGSAAGELNAWQADPSQAALWKVGENTHPRIAQSPT